MHTHTHTHTCRALSTRRGYDDVSPQNGWMGFGLATVTRQGGLEVWVVGWIGGWRGAASRGPKLFAHSLSHTLSHSLFPHRLTSENRGRQAIGHVNTAIVARYLEPRAQMSPPLPFRYPHAPPPTYHRAGTWFSARPIAGFLADHTQTDTHTHIQNQQMPPSCYLISDHLSFFSSCDAESCCKAVRALPVQRISPAKGPRAGLGAQRAGLV